MYVPPYSALLRGLGLSKEGLSDNDIVTIPVSVLKLLIKGNLATESFDEEGYLRENPDVSNAVRDNKMKDGFEHYIRIGYFEGRKGGTRGIDENWYKYNYSDVASALRQGQLESATSHYEASGAAEGRSPRAEAEQDAAVWRSAFQAVTNKST